MDPKERHVLFHREPNPVDPGTMIALWSILFYICVLSSSLFRRDSEEGYSITGSFKFRVNLE
jgi:hypothetical protein